MKKISFLLVLLFGMMCFLKSVNTNAQIAQSDSIGIKNAKDSLAQTIEAVKGIDNEIERLKEEYKALKKRVDMANKNLNKNQNQLTALNDLIDSLIKKQHEIQKETLNKLDQLNIANRKVQVLDSILLDKQNKQEQADSLLAITKSQSKSDSANLTNIRKAVDSVKNLLESIKDTLVVIAEVHLNRQPVSIYIDTSAKNCQTSKRKTNLSITTTSFKIEKIRMRIKEGIILNIYVFDSAGNIYRNKKSPISLTYINEERKFDKLYADPNGNSNQIELKYVRLSDVIRYIPRRSFNYFPYVDVEIDLSQKDSIYYIRENTSVNAYVNVAVFSDINGISGGANGLAQIDLAGKFITQTKNVRNTALILFNYFSAHGYVGKFDNQFKGADLLAGDSVKRIDLMQRSYFSIGARQNLMHWVLSPLPRRLIEDITIDVGFNFNGARVRNIFDKDTVANSKTMDTTYRVVTQNQFFIEPKMTFTRNSNFGCSVSTAFIYQGVKKSSQLANTEMRFYFHPAINFYYHSKKEPENRIFLRYTHMVDMKKPQDAFFQLQLGYSASVTKLLSM